MLRLLNHFKAGSAYLLIVWISFVVPTSASAEFSQEVLEIQQGLERLGYNSRPFDGLWGAVTQAALDEFCEDQSLQCGGLEFPAVLNFIHEGISELPETEINRLLALRQTINPFLAWNRSDLALMRGDYGLHWGLTPGPGENTIRLNEIYWNYYYPNKPWLNYPGIDQYLTDRNWGHAAEYGLTLATNINSGEFLEYISGIALHRMNASSSHGVMLDWWHDYHSGGFSRAEVRRARLSFASMLRETLGDDAIILGNVSWLREVASLRYLNGVFLELSKEPYLERRPTLYTRDELYRIEDLLIYYERNLSYPRLIALEGWRQTLAVSDADRNTSANRRMAKIMTAMSVVIPTNGYILYGDNNPDTPEGDHFHLYYDFYSFDVGQPTSGYQQVSRGVGFKEHDRGVVAYNITGRDVVFETSGGREIIAPANSGLFCEYVGNSERCLSAD